MRLILAAVSLLLMAAAPPDPLLERLIASARAVPPASIAFDRTLRIVSQEKDAPAETHVRTDRWDGKRLTLLTVDGKPASPQQVADAQKAAAGRPAPGYNRLAVLLAGAVRTTDAQGRTVYRVASLPKGSYNVGKEISNNLVGEATVDTSGPQPYVSRFRASLPKPLSFFMVAKLDTFDQVNDYSLGADGKPVQLHRAQMMAGSQFGTVGTTRSEVTYAPR